VANAAPVTVCRRPGALPALAWLVLAAASLIILARGRRSHSYATNTASAVGRSRRAADADLDDTHARTRDGQLTISCAESAIRFAHAPVQSTRSTRSPVRGHRAVLPLWMMCGPARVAGLSDTEGFQGAVDERLLDILEMSWITESSPPERRVGLRIMARDQAELARPEAEGSIVTFGCAAQGVIR